MEDSSSISCKVFETFSALQAELDNTVRSERTRRGMEAKIMAGIFPWRSPLGYRSIQAKKHGEKKTRPDDPDPVLFPIIQSALRLYATGQYSQQDMLRLLDEKGLAAARGVKTHFQQVNRMLYQALDFYHGYLLNPWSGERVKGQQRAMLGDEEYWRIIAVRDGRGQGRAVKKIHDNPLFPLRRLLVCADCGRFYTGSVSHGHGGAYPYYRCQTKGCPASGKSIRPAEAETQVGELLARFQLTACFLSELKQSLSQVLDEVNRETTGKLALLDRQLAELVEKKKHIYEMREDGSYTKEEFLARKNTLESEIGRLEFERFTLAGQTYDLDEVFSYAQEFVQRFGNHWTQMPPEIWHRFHMLVFPDGISYHRERGYGTVKIGLIFGLFEDFQTTGSSLVPLAEVRLNLIHEELGKLAQIAQQFLTQAIP